MPTRFYFGSTDSDNAVSPAFDSNWEQTGEATRRKLYVKSTLLVLTAITNKQITVPITTTQDILNVQFVSDPIPTQNIDTSVLFSMVVRCSENATTNNAHIAYSLRVCSQDGGTIRGTLASSFANASEFPLTASAATRIIGSATTIAVTALVTLPGDRLVLEVGVHVSAPTAAGSAIQRFGNNAASDFALTTALTTDLNPWAELSRDVFGTVLNNYQSVKGGAGILSFGERIR